MAQQQQLSRVRNLYAYQDGDHIDARMGVQIDAGYGLTQFWDIEKGKVTNTDFTQHPPTLYPFPYSSRKGQYVLPETQGQQWYYNNPETETAGILDASGKVKSAYASLFQTTTVVIGKVTYPALKIIGNLAKAGDLTDKHIYYKSTYNGKPFTCTQPIPIQTTVGEATEILLSLSTDDGSGSNVLSNTNKWVQITAALQRAGATIASGVTYKWQKLVDGTWRDVTTQLGIIELVDSKTIKVYGAGVDSEDIFRVAATCDGQTKYKTQQLTDTADTYYIYEGCSQAGDAVEEGVNVSFNPVVYDRSNNAPDTTNTWHFTFFLLNLISGANVGSASTTVPFVVPYATVERETGVTVVIQASNA